MILKKPLPTRRREGTTGGSPTRSEAADHVCRCSAVRPDEPATAVLGTAPHQARRRFATHSRIYPSLRRGLSAGWDLRLSDHADIEHGVLPELPQYSVTKVCQGGYPPGP